MIQVSIEVQYVNIPQGASKLPEIKDLELCNLFNKRGILMPHEIKHHAVPHFKGLYSDLERSNMCEQGSNLKGPMSF